jgi:hypothetical protein
MTVVRDMLLSLESKLLRNTEVQETMKKEREQEKTGEMSEEERRRINQEFKEYKEILRQIDAQLVYEKDPKKREELLKIRASVIGTNNKTNNNKKNNKTTTNQLKRNNIE